MGRVEMMPASTLGKYRWPIHEILGMFQGAFSDGCPQRMKAKMKARSTLKANGWERLRSKESCQGKRAGLKRCGWGSVLTRVGQWGLERWRIPGLPTSKAELVLQVLPGAQNLGGVLPASSQARDHNSSTRTEPYMGSMRYRKQETFCHFRKERRDLLRET